MLDSNCICTPGFSFSPLSCLRIRAKFSHKDRINHWYPSTWGREPGKTADFITGLLCNIFILQTAYQVHVPVQSGVMVSWGLVWTQNNSNVCARATMGGRTIVLCCAAKRSKEFSKGENYLQLLGSCIITKTIWRKKQMQKTNIWKTNLHWHNLKVANPFLCPITLNCMLCCSL